MSVFNSQARDRIGSYDSVRYDGNVVVCFGRQNEPRTNNDLYERLGALLYVVKAFTFGKLSDVRGVSIPSQKHKSQIVQFGVKFRAFQTDP